MRFDPDRSAATQRLTPADAAEAEAVQVTRLPARPRVARCFPCGAEFAHSACTPERCSDPQFQRFQHLAPLPTTDTMPAAPAEA